MSVRVETAPNRDERPTRAADNTVSVREGAVLGVAWLACLLARAVHVDRAFGLPAHPLLIHLPVVAIPTLALVSIPLALRADWRARHGLLWALLALTALGGTVLAAGAGEELLEGFRNAPAPGSSLATHTDLAEVLEWVMFAFAAVVLVSAVLRHRRLPRPAALLLGVATIALAVAAAYYVVRVGDAGARPCGRAARRSRCAARRRP